MQARLRQRLVLQRRTLALALALVLVLVLVLVQGVAVVQPLQPVHRPPRRQPLTSPRRVVLQGRQQEQALARALALARLPPALQARCRLHLPTCARFRPGRWAM